MLDTSLFSARSTVLVTLKAPRYFAGRTDIDFGRLDEMVPERSIETDYFDLVRPVGLDTIRSELITGQRYFGCETAIAVVATLTSPTMMNPQLLSKKFINLVFAEHWVVGVHHEQDMWRARPGIRIFCETDFLAETRIFRLATSRT